MEIDKNVWTPIGGGDPQLQQSPTTIWFAIMYFITTKIVTIIPKEGSSTSITL
jgi:hypothetical protein